MQVPIEPLEMSFPVDGYAAAPMFNAWPPDDRAGHAHDHDGHGAQTIDQQARSSAAQVIVKFGHPRDERGLTARAQCPVQLTPKDDQAAGQTDDEDVQPDREADPQVNLKEYSSRLAGVRAHVINYAEP